MSDAMVLSEVEDHILSISFNRPDKRNALTQQMYQQAAQLISTATEQPEVKVILLSGEGGNFTSGNDLKDFMVSGTGDSPVISFQKALMNTPKPVITAVDGMAIGIGVTLLLHTDINVVAHDARLQLPFVKLALVPEFASSYLLPLLAGRARASQILLTGEPFSGQTALDIGLASELSDASEIHARAMEIASQLAKLPPSAVRQTKALIHQGINQLTLENVFKEELSAFAASLASAEHREAVTAFFAKRAPDFSQFE